MIDGVAVPAWPATGSLAAGVGTLALVRYLARHRGKPGAGWFLATLLAQATWCFAYGLALLTFDPVVRRLLESLVWFGIVWTGVTFLAFALEYTGRGHVIRSRLFAPFAAVAAITTLLALTNSLHGLLWTDFAIDPAFGAAAVSYTLQPWAYVAVGVETVAVASAVFLLVDTLVDYGPLYRREAAAVATSALPPGFALLAWAAGVGPTPQLNLAPILFIPHVVLDAYAFGRAEMFERDPTALRAAERTAIDDLADPIAVVDSDRRVVRVNAAAREAFALGDDEAVRLTPLAAALPFDIDLTDPDPVDVRSADGRRTYAVSVSPLSDPAGTRVGHTVVFSDVTERERRRQQLEVLNRVLRHNLRNDMGVVHGYAELLAEEVEDDGHHRMADAIERRSGALLALGEKARTVETLLAGEEATPLALGALVERVVADCREEFPDADVALTVRDDPTAPFPETTVAAAVENLIENALRHHDGAGVERPDGGPWARVTVAREGGEAVVRVADDGPGIPEGELDAIEAGRETALQHGSGLGLWIVHWAAAAVGAETDFADRDPRGTVATIRLPLGDAWTASASAAASTVERETAIETAGE